MNGDQRAKHFMASHELDSSEDNYGSFSEPDHLAELTTKNRLFWLEKGSSFSSTSAFFMITGLDFETLCLTVGMFVDIPV